MDPGYFTARKLHSAAIKPVPYVAIFQLASASSADKVTDGMNGFQLAHLICKDDGSVDFVTYWQSYEHFRLNEKSLKDGLRINSIISQGSVDRVSPPKPPFWERMDIKTKLLSIAAIFGALQALSIYFDRFFAAPSLIMSADQTLDLTQTRKFSTNIIVENVLPIAHSDLKIGAHLRGDDGKTLPLRVSEPVLGALSSGKTRTFSVSGIAPIPGAYRLETSISAKAGLLRLVGDFRTSSNIVVWPVVPDPHLTFDKKTSDYADYTLAVKIGEEARYGLDCDLTSTGFPGVKFDNSGWRSGHPSSGRRSGAGGEGQDASLTVMWTWAPVSAYTVLAAELTFQGDAATDWKAFEREARIRCEPLKEKVNA